MSGPFVYNPPQYQPNPYFAPSPIQSHYSPFLPPSNISPYHGPGSLPPSPQPHHIQLAGVGAPAGYSPFASGYLNMAAQDYVRPRTKSWTSAQEVPPAAFLGVPTTASTGYRSSHGRSRSFSGTPAHAPVSLPPGWPPVEGVPQYGAGLLGAQPNPPVLFHPWLNGEFSKQDFFFNLADPHLLPQKAVSGGKAALLAMEELAQPATHPPVSKMRILVDKLPQWPIDLAYNPQLDERQAGGYYGVHAPQALPPISIGDVLAQAHRQLHQRISHADWDRLSGHEEKLVTKAFARRCRAMGAAETAERADGVKRVDFLLDRIIFKGLVRTESPDVFILITGHMNQ
ncbi:hypothetical protein DL96DRAFT_1704956 [Flagelloscypha sp. PMI_526]|nr:hypothetical protein DL96DRAFT_1704956 [Flagelloscypha sp. PMI_526]